MRRTFTVLLGLRDRPPNYMRQIQIRFGRYQFGQKSKPSMALCAPEVLGHHRWQSQENRMDFGLYLKQGSRRATIPPVRRHGPAAHRITFTANQIIKGEIHLWKIDTSS